MNLGYGQIEDALVAALTIPEADRMKLRSRIQHLQNAGLVKRGSKGRGHRATYGEEDLLKLCGSLALVNAQWPAKAAAAFVIEQWPAFHDSLASSLHDAEDRIIAVLEMDGEIIARSVGRQAWLARALDPTPDVIFELRLEFPNLAKKALASVQSSDDTDG